MKEPVVMVSSKGHVVIPRAVRKHLGIERGDKITFLLDTEGQVVVKVIKQPTLTSLRGAAGKLKTALSWEEMRQIAREDHL